MTEGFTRKIRAAAARDHGADRLPLFCGGDERRAASSAGTKIAHAQVFQNLLASSPMRGVDEAVSEEIDIETEVGGELIGFLFLGGEQVEEQGADARLAQSLRHVLIPGAVAAAAAAMCEKHQARGTIRHRKLAMQEDTGRGHFDLGSFEKLCSGTHKQHSAIQLQSLPDTPLLKCRESRGSATSLQPIFSHSGDVQRLAGFECNLKAGNRLHNGVLVVAWAREMLR